MSFFNPILDTLDFPGGSVVKNLPANAGATGDTSLIPGLDRSPGGGNGNPLQYSCLKKSHGQRGSGLQCEEGTDPVKLQVNYNLGKLGFFFFNLPLNHFYNCLGSSQIISFNSLFHYLCWFCKFQTVFKGITSNGRSHLGYRNDEEEFDLLGIIKGTMRKTH